MVSFSAREATARSLVLCGAQNWTRHNYVGVKCRLRGFDYGEC